MEASRCCPGDRSRAGDSQPYHVTAGAGLPWGPEMAQWGRRFLSPTLQLTGTISQTSHVIIRRRTSLLVTKPQAPPWREGPAGLLEGHLVSSPSWLEGPYRLPMSQKSWHGSQNIWHSFPL